MLEHKPIKRFGVTSPELVQVRQLSGVLLRKNLRSHWRRLPAAAHKQIQTALQQRLVQESVEPVRRAVAELIASIARWVLCGDFDPMLCMVTSAHDVVLRIQLKKQMLTLKAVCCIGCAAISCTLWHWVHVRLAYVSLHPTLLCAYNAHLWV